MVKPTSSSQPLAPVNNPMNVTSKNDNPDNAYEVLPSPSDGVSSLSFSPMAGYLVATSWDNQVRCWEVQSGSSRPLAAISHDAPVLCSVWAHDGTAVFSGGCDKQVKLWSLMEGAQPITVAMHDAPVKEVAWIPEINLLASSSWDKTIRYWDCRQAQPAHIQLLPDKCVAMPVKYPLMVVGTLNQNIIVYDLRNPQTEYQRFKSPLNTETRCLAIFPNKEGFLIGSLGGRVAVHHFIDSQPSKNFSFKCHREGEHIYAVNSLNFHPVHHTVASTGSDGTISIWDKDNRQRLRAFPKYPAPIPCGTFNADGSLFAYAVCYDWSKGAAHHDPSTAKSRIYLHAVQESEVQPKPPKK